MIDIQGILQQLFGRMSDGSLCRSCIILATLKTGEMPVWPCPKVNCSPQTES